jgi:hypothetical protein
MEVDLDVIKQIISAKPKTVVKPREFFIAWQGVPTLAYQGFSPTLLDIKTHIREKIPNLREENHGSLWPKTTLGAMGDGKYLTLEEASKLREICSQLNQHIDPHQHRFEIGSLSIVEFECRSLERRRDTYQVQLEGTPGDNDDPTLEHAAFVHLTMEQFSADRLPEYLPNLNREGNRVSHYQEDHVEATLVYDLPKPELQPPFIKQFQDAVDKELPGLYTWFEPKSRHMTVRALA